MMANHMTEVAQMLGVEIGEVFKITDDTYGIRQSYYRLTEENGCEISDDNTSWVTVRGSRIMASSTFLRPLRENL